MVEKKVSPLLLEGVKILLPALILVLLVNTFILRLFVIPSPSMEPALRTNDYIVAAKFSYWFNTPQRGEIIVFKHPLDPRVYMVKRIIGLPGEGRKAWRIRLPSSIRMGMFWRFGSVLDNRPVAVTA
jgi:signal peptidase I